MKVKDMEKLIGTETPVAVASSTAEWAQDSATRAVIVAVRQERRVHSGARWDIGGHKASDGVLVRYLDQKDGAEREQIVGARQVLGEWSVYAEERQRRLDQKANRANAIDRAKQRAEQSAARIGDGARAVPVTPYREFRVIGWKVELSLDAAERVAGQLSPDPLEETAS